MRDARLSQHARHVAVQRAHGHLRARTGNGAPGVSQPDQQIAYCTSRADVLASALVGQQAHVQVHKGCIIISDACVPGMRKVQG
jgi:hypothetical protein